MYVYIENEEIKWTNNYNITVKRWSYNENNNLYNIHFII